jgi:hypothetical protein
MSVTLSVLLACCPQQTASTDVQSRKCPEDSARYRSHLFSHSGYMLRVFVYAMSVQGWADTQEKLEPVTEIVAVVTIERIGAVVDGKLGAETYVDAVAVR